jgi:hypothetical protein
VDQLKAALARTREVTVEAHHLVLAGEAADLLVDISGS